MNKLGHFINLYPLEKLLPDLDEKEIQDIVNNCDYTIEVNAIAKNMQMKDCYVSCADAAVFYQMGYEAAQKRLDKVLIPEKK